MSTPSSISVLIDSREPRSIERKLTNLGVPCTRMYLEVGDYQIADVLVERKTVSDLLSSVYSGRLYRQLYSLRHTDLLPILVVTGKLSSRKWRIEDGRRVPDTMSLEEYRQKYSTLMSAIATSILSFRIPVVQVRTEDDLVYLLRSIYKRKSTTQKSYPVVSRPKHYRSVMDAKIAVISSLPGIGGRLATYIAENYTLREFVNLSSEQLMSIPGLGRVKARNIEKILTS